MKTNELRTVDLRAVERGYIADGTYRLTVDGFFVGVVSVSNGHVTRTL